MESYAPGNCAMHSCDGCVVRKLPAHAQGTLVFVPAASGAVATVCLGMGNRPVIHRYVRFQEHFSIFV